MFKPTKIGLLNFWLYDEEEFSFFDGKLLLRGANGSGKSVTMQSFIPLILDGNKSPKRLDTFGSSDKHIEYYLLGENNEKEDSTGYLYMEFYDESKEEYITIGMGLRARVGKNTDFFGFALKDGKRINKDFFLYKCQDGIHKTPYTKLELKAALGPQNLFVETTKEYKKMVNDLLFQFPNLDSYDEFIQVLLQLRSPKLSKEFKPTKLMEVLNDVLPPLADKDLRPLSDTIESLNQTREKMEDLQEKIKTIGNFVKIYQNYNETILYQKAKLYLEKQTECDSLIKMIKQRENTIEEKTKEIETVKQEQKNLEEEYLKAKFEKEQINNQDLEEKTIRKVELENILKELSQKIEREEDTLTTFKQKLTEIKKSSQEIEKEFFELDKEKERTTTEILDLGSQMHFDSFLTAFKPEKMTSDYLQKLIKEKEEEIQNILTLLEKKQKIIEEQNESSNEFEKIKVQYEKNEQEKEELDIALEEEMTFFFQALRNVKETNQYLKIEDTDYREIIGYLEEYNKENYALSKAKYEDIYQSLYATTTMNLANEKNTQKQLKENLLLEQKKLEELENESELSFEENQIQKESVEYIKENQIPYLSFYQAVEFQNGLSEEVCSKLEESLHLSGILNAKIFKETDLSKIKNQNISYLIPSTKKRNNLTKYVKPASNDIFTASYITSILESISIDEKDELWINEKSYRFDFLKSATKGKYESKYIGILKRKKKHEEEISYQKEIVEKIEKEVEEKEKKIVNLEKKIEGLMIEREKYPNNIQLENLCEEISKKSLTINFLHEKMKELDEKIRDQQKQIERILQELEAYRGPIPLRIDSYQNLLEELKELQEQIIYLEKVLDKISSKQEILNTLQERLEDITASHDKTHALLSEYIDEKKTREIEITTIEKILQTKEYQELSKKLHEYVEIIDSYSEKSNVLARKTGILEQQLLQEKKLLVEENIQKEQSLIYQEIAFSLFEEEIKLKYVTEENASKETAKKIVQNLKDQDRDIVAANASYYRAFNEYRQDLLDYAISDIQLFDERETIIESYKQKNVDENIIREMYQNARRQDILTSYQGKKLGLYALQEALKESYEADKIYLDEQDRHLFEDILLRTIGGKIKEKIMDAQEWVKNINQIMSEKQKDSALSFFLEWRPKSQETLEEMNTKELVEIFMLDEGQAKPNDIDRLVKHFRSKIRRAEEFMDESHESYFDMIFNILDYRNWFNFKLFYRKNESDKKELTDKIFSVFSGGEKAKTMYVPLFASVYAKLDSASPLSPRLIALDEAFAGVDEKNIEEMFSILESFKLDYILTSQALWCDYKEIKDISICELIKAKNASSVAIRRYRWNGLVREVII